MQIFVHDTGRESVSCTKHCSSAGLSMPAKPGAGRIVSPKSTSAQEGSSTDAAPKQSGGSSCSCAMSRVPRSYSGAFTNHAVPATSATA